MLKKYYFTLLMVFLIGITWAGITNNYGKLICETPILQGFWLTIKAVIVFTAIFVSSFLAGREHTKN